MPLLPNAHTNFPTMTIAASDMVREDWGYLKNLKTFSESFTNQNTMSTNQNKEGDTVMPASTPPDRRSTEEGHFVDKNDSNSWGETNTTEEVMTNILNLFYKSIYFKNVNFYNLFVQKLLLY